MELDREGKSYTFLTLRELKNLYPDDEIYYIIGGDSLAYIDKWYRAEDFLTLCTFAVYPRDDNDIDAVIRQCKALYEKFGARCEIIETRKAFDKEIISVSSTKIREMLKNGADVEKYLPEKVYKYIIEKDIYK